MREDEHEVTTRRRGVGKRVPVLVHWQSLLKAAYAGHPTLLTLCPARWLLSAWGSFCRNCNALSERPFPFLSVNLCPRIKRWRALDISGGVMRRTTALRCEQALASSGLQPVVSPSSHLAT